MDSKRRQRIDRGRELFKLYLAVAYPNESEREAAMTIHRKIDALRARAVEDAMNEIGL